VKVEMAITARDLYEETGDPEAIADLVRALRRATNHSTEVA